MPTIQLARMASCKTDFLCTLLWWHLFQNKISCFDSNYSKSFVNYKVKQKCIKRSMKSHFFAVIESSEMVYISELHQVFSGMFVK